MYVALLGDLARYLGMEAGSPKDALLFTFTSWARVWAKQQKLDLNIRPLTMAMLGLEGSSLVYPELTSRIKASRARVLLAYCSRVAVKMDPKLMWLC